MSSAEGTSLASETVGPVRIVRIDREHAGNSVDLATAREFLALLDACSGDATVRAIVVTGAGSKFFCSGGDIKAYRRLQTKDEARAMSRAITELLRALERHRAIVIAAIDGYAVGGGCELALSCDIRLASPRAKFGLPQVKLGITPGWGGWRRMAQTVGSAKALELMVTGDVIDAHAACALGLVNAVEEGSVVEAAVRLGERIARSPARSVTANKRLIREAMELPFDAGDALAEELFADAWVSDEHRAAEAAFAKR